MSSLDWLPLEKEDTEPKLSVEPAMISDTPSVA